MKTKRGRGVSYAKYGYLFILPFFIVYIFFTLIPQIIPAALAFSSISATR